MKERIPYIFLLLFFSKCVVGMNADDNVPKKTIQTKNIFALGFSCNDSYLVSGSHAFAPYNDDKTVLAIWDYKTGACIKELLHDLSTDHSGGIRRLACNPVHDASFATGDYQGSVQLWDARSNTAVKSFKKQQHAGWINGICYNTEGTMIVTCGNDDKLRLYDSVGDKWKDIYKHENKKLLSLAWHPNGKQISIGTRWHFTDTGEYGLTTLYYANLKKSKAPKISCSRTTEDSILALCYNHTGEKLAMGVHVMSNTTDTPQYNVSIIDKINGHTKNLPGHIGSVCSLDYSPDDRYLASASNDHTIKIWDTGTRALAWELMHVDDVHSVCYSPNGQVLATGTRDGIITLVSTAHILAQHRSEKELQE